MTRERGDAPDVEVELAGRRSPPDPDPDKFWLVYVTRHRRPLQPRSASETVDDVIKKIAMSAANRPIGGMSAPEIRLLRDPDNHWVDLDSRRVASRGDMRTIERYWVTPDHHLMSAACVCQYVSCTRDRKACELPRPADGIALDAPITKH